VRDAECEARLADAGRAHERQEPNFVSTQHVQCPPHVRCAADERGWRSWQIVRRDFDPVLEWETEPSRSGRKRRALGVSELQRIRQQGNRVWSWGAAPTSLQGADGVAAHPRALGERLLGQAAGAPVPPQYFAEVGSVEVLDCHDCTPCELYRFPSARCPVVLGLLVFDVLALLFGVDSRFPRHPERRDRPLWWS
jgi:hypothetical protein